MEIKTASSEELLERRTAIAGELDAPEADLDALEAEVRAINEELETRKNNEAKKAEVRQAIANGEQPAEKIKEFKEVEKMEERTFAPDTVEYRDAYMKQLMGKPMSIEERTALSGASYVIPTETVNKIETYHGNRHFRSGYKSGGISAAAEVTEVRIVPCGSLQYLIAILLGHIVPFLHNGIAVLVGNLTAGIEASRA